MAVLAAVGHGGDGAGGLREVAVDDTRGVLLLSQRPLASTGRQLGTRVVLQDVGLALRAGLVHLHRSVSSRWYYALRKIYRAGLEHLYRSVQDGIYALGKAYTVTELDLYTCTGQFKMVSMRSETLIELDLYTCTGQSVQDGIYALGKAYRAGLVPGAV